MLKRQRMQLTLVAATVLLLAGCATPPNGSSAAPANQVSVSSDALAGVDHWIKNDLNNQLISQLADQSRFKGRSVRVVAVRNGRRVESLSQLEHYSLRQIESAILQHQSIRLLNSNTDPSKCEQEQSADFQLALAIDPSADAATWRARLLETGSETWVSGYDFNQRISLDDQSKRMLKTVHAASVLAGSRDAPFNLQQTDLVGLALADSLICSLGPVASSVPVFLNSVETGNESDVLRVQLASALKRADSLRIVTSADSAQVQLNIARTDLGDGTLHVTVTPVKLGTDPDMPQTASVYQKAPTPVVRGENWRELNALAGQPALRQIKMDMPARVRAGETHTFSFTAGQAGRFWVLQVSPSDQLEMIFPPTQKHVDQGENLIAKGEKRSYSFVMEPPTGDYLMTVLLTDKNASLKDVLGDTKLANAPDVADFPNKGIRLLEPRDWGMMLHQMRID